MTRERLSATVESELLEAGRQAVAEGRAESVSAWVNDALRLKADHDRRMRALDEFIAVSIGNVRYCSTSSGDRPPGRMKSRIDRS